MQYFKQLGRDNSKYDYSYNWIKAIRQMEKKDGGMALNETINEETLLSDTPNNIDVHMLKNTEYGAAILLGASEYGKQGDPKTNNTSTTRRMDKGNTTGKDYQASTTGNVSGVYEIGYSSMNISKSEYEWVAGTLNANKIFRSSTIDSRYYDLYDDSENSAKPGDATLETNGWHGGSSGMWVNSHSSGFIRGGAGSFGFLPWDTSNGQYCRAGVVVGEGF